MPSFYEFFAGAGMARAGLGAGWTCLFANDFDAKKGLTYQANWGTGGELRVGDVREMTPGDLPGRADLIWGSFPCQDLSLAGVGAGLKGVQFKTDGDAFSGGGKPAEADDFDELGAPSDEEGGDDPLAA